MPLAANAPSARVRFQVKLVVPAAPGPWNSVATRRPSRSYTLTSSASAAGRKRRARPGERRGQCRAVRAREIARVHAEAAGNRGPGAQREVGDQRHAARGIGPERDEPEREGAAARLV